MIETQKGKWVCLHSAVEIDPVTKCTVLSLLGGEQKMPPLSSECHRPRHSAITEVLALQKGHDTLNIVGVNMGACEKCRFSGATSIF